VNADVAQVTKVTVSGTPNNGDVYSLLATQVTSGGEQNDYTAGAGETADDVADGLGGATWDDTLIKADVAAAVITLTDQNPDNGGFTVITATNAAFGGSGASNDAAALATADIITDFLSGTDKIDLNLVAGSGSNYAEGAAAGYADYTAALTAAAGAMNGTVQFFFAFVTEGTATTDDDYGVLIFDANNDKDVDGVIKLEGVITNDGFAAGDIAA
jgi:hypothetical protein